ncbi:MAG: hypothetical protein K8I82_11605, partial [Anaerolineae bacterium]|nr:hypothetical protein [Anaerolineae bacterium]
MVMINLKSTLLDYDIDLLILIAHRWDVDLDARDVRAAAEQVAEFMLQPEHAAHEWSRLEDRERGALQVLLGAPEHKMPLAKYTRIYGEIRQMGPDKRNREKPHLSPVGIAEILYYRGLIAVTYDQSSTGAQPFIYVPYDLADILPTHATGYDLSQPDEFDEAEVDQPETVQRADTSLVDDLTTLLAYLQIESVTLTHQTLGEQERQVIENYLLGPAYPARIALLVALAAELGLAAAQEGFFKPVPAVARKWLEQPRTQQVQSMVQAWQRTPHYNELQHIQGLVLEKPSPNDPILLRKAIQRFLDTVVDEEWFLVEEFIETIKTEEPDFQRPAADYDSWYIRDEESDTYLKGFESWDRVDGTMLSVTLVGSMYWLGLLDYGDSQGRAIAHLTAYGRAYAGQTAWPDMPDPEASLTIEADGTIDAPRAVSRYSRFQLARFCDWGAPGDPFEYV